jgi:aerobic C4-dicarboxylate transport protein
MKRIVSHLTFQVWLAIVIGVIVGLNFPAFAPTAKLISQTFINMISMLIAPIVFFTTVLGIAQMDDMKKVGRVGGKALIYFEVATTLAIVIGLIVANIFQPGNGFDVNAAHPDASKIQTYQESASGFNWGEFITHIIPRNVFDAFARGDMLQILFFAVFFGFGLSKMGSAGTSLIVAFDKVFKVLFNIMKVIMKLAPIGAFGGMAFTIGTYGLDTLYPLGKLMIAVYITMALFIFVVLNAICYFFKFSLWQYLKFIRQEIVIVLGTSSSESVLPSMMQRMEKFGCSKSVVGMVIPTGYSFNMDGTAIYLSMAVIFLSQAFNINLSLAQQITVISVLMITSKGTAGVTGNGFIVLVSTLTALKIIPVESIAVLLGVDRFMSEARAITNMIGNGVAAVVIAKSEKEFDQKAYQKAINPKTADLVLET